LACHQQPLWQLLERITNSAKILASTTAFKVQSHRIPSGNQVVLQL
jgi:hypothetical protein